VFGKYKEIFLIFKEIIDKDDLFDAITPLSISLPLVSYTTSNGPVILHLIVADIQYGFST